MFVRIVLTYAENLSSSAKQAYSVNTPIGSLHRHVLLDNVRDDILEEYQYFFVTIPDNIWICGQLYKKVGLRHLPMARHRLDYSPRALIPQFDGVISSSAGEGTRE